MAAHINKSGTHINIFPMSESMKEMVKELLSENYMLGVQCILHDAFRLRKSYIKRSHRSVVHKNLTELHKLTKELIGSIKDLDQTTLDLLSHRMAYEIEYPATNKMSKTSFEEIDSTFGFYQRLMDDLEYLNDASAIDITPRGSWEKDYKRYLVVDLYCLWERCHGSRPKRAYDSYTGEESGKFRALVMSALNEIEPGAKAPDGIIRKILTSVSPTNSIS